MSLQNHMHTWQGRCDVLAKIQIASAPIGWMEQYCSPHVHLKNVSHDSIAVPIEWMDSACNRWAAKTVTGTIKKNKLKTRNQSNQLVKLKYCRHWAVFSSTSLYALKRIPCVDKKKKMRSSNDLSPVINSNRLHFDWRRLWHFQIDWSELEC